MKNGRDKLRDQENPSFKMKLISFFKKRQAYKVSSVEVESSLNQKTLPHP